MTAKVLLAEDLTLLRSGVRALLESTGKVQIVGEAADGREALKLAQKLTPDVVLMDVAMPEMNGIEAARQIRKALPQVRVMMLSMHADRQYIFESLRAGASGYVLKNAAPTELLSAIQTVVTGGTFLSASLAELVMDDYLRRARGQHAETEMEKLSAHSAKYCSFWRKAIPALKSRTVCTSARGRWIPIANISWRNSTSIPLRG